LGGPLRDVDDETLLAAYATHEATAEAGAYLPYREVLATAARGVARDHNVPMTDGAARTFGVSVGDWPAFPDSADALTRLKHRYRLGVITNCDDDLFACSNRRLGVTFDWIITAQQVGSYKPNPRNFEVAFERMGVPRDRILHVAQSLFHDHVPAKRLGLTTAWINRRHDRSGSGATPPAVAKPDLEAPDMATFADLATAAAAERT
jgi:2-haloacid dehalogenase